MSEPQSGPARLTLNPNDDNIIIIINTVYIGGTYRPCYIIIGYNKQQRDERRNNNITTDIEIQRRRTSKSKRPS